MSDLSPVDQIAAVEHRHAGNVCERRSREEIIALSVGADRGIGVPAGEYGIIIGTFIGKRILHIEIIVSLVRERLKDRCISLRLHVGLT